MFDTFISVWEAQDLAQRTIEHLHMFSIALILAVALGVIIGILLYRRPKLAGASFNVLNVVEIIPTLALLILLLPLLGLGGPPTIAACVLYSLLPIARNTYTGLTSVNKAYIEVAWGMGLSSVDILLRIRLPLALPLIIGGIRIAIVFTMGVITLGGLTAAGGLGAVIQLGINFTDVNIILVSGLTVGILAVAEDFAVLVYQERRADYSFVGFSIH